MAQVVRTTKEIMGVDMATGSEWDAGYIPAAFCYRAVRITVRKDAADRFTVYALGRKGTEVLAVRDIASLECESCAKALGLCIVFGCGYAACGRHGGVAERDVYDGALAALLAVMGIDDADWAALEDGARHRIMWVVRGLLDGQKEWGQVIRKWDAERAERPNASLSVAVRSWFASLSFP